MGVPNPKRLTDNDREMAAARLREAFIHGVLTHEELNARVEAALHAATTDDLASILNDLPVLTTTPEPIRLAVTNGHVDRIGNWRVPAQISLELNRATSTLDFRMSALPAEGVGLTVQAARSRIVLLVQPGQRVAYENVGRHKSQIQDRSSASRPGAGAADAEIQVFGNLYSSTLRILAPRRGFLRR
jgi:hypothetical protein